MILEVESVWDKTVITYFKRLTQSRGTEVNHAGCPRAHTGSIPKERIERFG